MKVPNREEAQLNKVTDEKLKKNLAFHVAMELRRARLRKGLTQENLAKKIGTQQPSIARIERGYLPSLSFLDKIAKKGFNSYLVPPRFAFLLEREQKPKKELTWNESVLLEDSASQNTSSRTAKLAFYLDKSDNQIRCGYPLGSVNSEEIQEKSKEETLKSYSL